jgi:hypothetical protein
MPVGLRSAFVLGVLCAAALLVAPQAAIAGKRKKAYEGPVAAQAVPVFGAPTIQLKIQFEERDGKLVPFTIPKLAHRAIPLYCPNGKTIALAGTTEPGFLPPRSIKKRRFALDLRGDDSNSNGGTPNEVLQVNGSVPRKGPLTGTIRVTTLAAPEFGGGLCDSGVVSWRASRVPAFSSPS